MNRLKRTDLGLYICMLHHRPGLIWSTYMIAAFCDTTHQNIWLLEKRAMKKLRKLLEARVAN